MATERWEIDSAHSEIRFSVRHLVVGRVYGQFTRWCATVFVEGADLSRASVDVLIDASSFDSGVFDRDAHIKSKDFIDVARYPEITFKSSHVAVASDVRLVLTGELTIRDVAREVVLEVERCGCMKDVHGNQRAALAATATIDRRDFGLTWNRPLEAGGFLVGERIDVESHVEAVRQASAA